MDKRMISRSKIVAIADAIREKTGSSEEYTLSEMAEAIASITGGSGGSSDLVKYVTFMSDDGTELYVKPTIAGDDCVNVVSKGLLERPTKTSTAQYSYTYSGWSLTPGGLADSNALKNVTEDRVLYASFTSAIRYYDIVFDLGDGVTKTLNLAYGSMPDYTPSKDGYNFDGWTPELAVVTGSATYTAKWVEATVSLADYSWDEIATLSESGQAGMFSVGDSKVIDVTDDSGYTSPFTVTLIGVNHDNLADGSGKAGMTFCMTPGTTPDVYGSNHAQYTITGSILHYQWESVASYSWASYDLRTKMNTTDNYIYAVMPTEVSEHVKIVSKKYYDIATGEILTSDDAFFIESLSELGFESGHDEGSCYALYTRGKSLTDADTDLIRNDHKNTTAAAWWTRSKFSPSWADGASAATCYRISDTGLPTLVKPNTKTYICICFCI